MKVNFARKGLVLAVVAVTLPASLATANAAATQTLALWNMNETAGATVMADSSGNGISGAIRPQATLAPAITTGVLFDGATGYRWSNVMPNQPPAKPERVIQIANNSLNPGTRDFAVSFRYRTTRPFGNIMQKGQAATPGGQFKFELPTGKVTCLVRGSAGRRAITTTGTFRDGQWHTVRCERTYASTPGSPAGIVLTVSDSNGNLQETRRLNGQTGNVSNTVPMTIGGKINCDQIEVTCDYFAGDIDWARFEVSP